MAAQRAAEVFASSDFFQESQHIGCYLARSEEFDCSAIIEKIWQAGKNCYLPVLSKQADIPLDFAAYKSTDTLSQNRYKILEPAQTEIFPTEKLDLVLVPLVAFDSHGHRLGMGGGYYDRTFSFLLKKPKTPYFVGLAYQLQATGQLPTEPWDVHLQAVITEQELIHFQK